MLPNPIQPICSYGKAYLGRKMRNRLVIERRTGLYGLICLYHFPNIDAQETVVIYLYLVR
jgi:hypothetical protein